jgi:flagellar biosynthetic protein FlhB
MANRAEKIFPALPQKRQRAREQGQIARSRDLVSAVSFVFATIIATATMGVLGNAVIGGFDQALAAGASDDLERTIGVALFHPLFMVVALSGFLAFTALVGAGVQGGIVFAPAKLMPDLSRLNPGAYFGRIFAGTGALELGKAALKIVLVAVIGWQAASWALAAGAKSTGVGPQLLIINAAVHRLLSWSAALALAAAGADYAHKRYMHEAELRMTRQEFLDDLKHEEGNPQVKRALRRAMRKGFKRIRGIHQAATATVILTNPTHYAVALRYRRGFDSAPLVVAKGAGENAHRLVVFARLAAVPVIENKPLCRALFRGVEVGDQIPRHFYRAVVEVLGMIMRVDNIRVDAQRQQNVLPSHLGQPALSQTRLVS